MKRYLFLIICLFLLSPIFVNAQEYNFDICTNCEWNDSNVDELEDQTRNITGQDDTVNINVKDSIGGLILSLNTNANIYFADKNIEIGEFYIDGFNDFIYDVNIYFGEKTYKIDEFSIAEFIFNPKIMGTGKNKTIIDSAYFYIGEGGDGTAELTMDNVKIDTYRIKLSDAQYNKVTLKNCDFSLTEITVGDYDGIGPTLIQNTILKKLYVDYSEKVIIDCDSRFIDGIKINYEDEDENQYTEDEATIMVWDDGQVVIETCKDKTIKINKKVTLDEIKNEYGYNIDNTWIFDPTGIVELKNNNLVPLKAGKTKLSKEINDEIKTLRLEVLPVDKSNKNIVNPKTMAPILIVLILSLLTIPITIFYKNKSMN